MKSLKVWCLTDLINFFVQFGSQLLNHMKALPDIFSRWKYENSYPEKDTHLHVYKNACWTWFRQQEELHNQQG